MTLRDYFAGQALVGYMSLGYNNLPMNWGSEHVTEACYVLADAMLEERSS